MIGGVARSAWRVCSQLPEPASHQEPVSCKIDCLLELLLHATTTTRHSRASPSPSLWPPFCNHATPLLPFISRRSLRMCSPPLDRRLPVIVVTPRRLPSLIALPLRLSQAAPPPHDQHHSPTSMRPMHQHPSSASTASSSSAPSSLPQRRSSLAAASSSPASTLGACHGCVHAEQQPPQEQPRYVRNAGKGTGQWEGCV